MSKSQTVEKKHSRKEKNVTKSKSNWKGLEIWPSV